MTDLEVEYWSARDVRDYLGLGSDRAARAQMQRWGVPEGPRDPVTGVKSWPRDAVRAAAETRPGRGYRTDVRGNAPPATAATIAEPDQKWNVAGPEQDHAVSQCDDGAENTPDDALPIKENS